MPSSVNVPSSISSASRSRAVSLSCSCWRAIRSSPPPSRACSRRSCRSSTSERSGGRATSVSAAARSVRHARPAQVVEHRLQHVHRRLGGHGALLLVVGRVEVRDLDAHQLASPRAPSPAGRRACRDGGRPGAGTAAGKCSGSITSRSRCTNTGAPSSAFFAATSVSTGLAPITVAALRSSSSRSPGSRSRTPASTTRSAGDRVAEAARPTRPSRRPGTCRRGSRCPTSRACCSRRGRRATGSARPAGARPTAGSVRRGHRAVGSQQHRRVAARERVLDLAAGLEQAPARLARGPPRSASRAPRRRCR